MFLQKDNLNTAIEAVAEGSIIGIPTETVYGLGVDPYSEEAVKSLFNIKERDDSKPVSLLVPSYDSVHKLNIITDIPEVVDLYWPGPLTVVVETSEKFVDGVGTKSPNTIGIRVPDNELAIELLNITGPLAVTSANLTGQKEAKNHQDAEEIFKDSVKHYIEGEAVHGNGSTVVDLREPGGEILREGPLKWPPSYC
jgi:tRNA threonylcarbamoyl adenosine modification protein (Sua5/YciO/YrdC/YwlC family)